MAARGRPKINQTPYKVGDVVMFLKDLKKDDYSPSRPNWNSQKRIIIPKHIPVVITQVNNHHLWVEYKGEIHWIRYIPSRMISATEAAQVLFGDKK